MGSALLVGLLATAAATDVGWMEVSPGHLADGAIDVDVDDAGFLWFATQRGLVRFDGERTVRFTPPDQRMSVWRVTVALGREWVTNRAGQLWVRDGDVLVPVVREDGAQRFADRMDGDTDNLWTYDDGELQHLDASGVWRTHTPEDLSGWVIHLRATPEEVYLAGTGGLWRVGLDGSQEHLTDQHTVDVAPLSGGRLAVLGRGTHLWEPDGTTTELMADAPGRDKAMVARDDVLFVAYDQALYRVPLQGEPTRYRRPDRGGPPTMEDLLVAPDGALWSGTVRLPEPDTLLLGLDEGVPSAGRWVTIDPKLGVTHYSSWEGYAQVTLQGVRPHPLEKTRTSMICLHPDGRPIGFAHAQHIETGLYDFSTGELLIATPMGADCAPSSTGGTLHAAPGYLLEVGAEGIEVYDTPEKAYRTVVETQDGTLVMTGWTYLCEARASAVRAREPEPWRCQELPRKTGPSVAAVLEAAPNLVWLATEGDGLWERRGPGQWGPSPVNELLEVREVNRLHHSPSGGVWVQQGRAAVRIEQDGNGWRLAERLDDKLGMFSPMLGLDEGPEGDLWAATATGTAYVPAHRRPERPPAFPARLLAAFVDGVRTPLPVEMAAASTVELDFASLAHGWSDELRYRWRLGEGAWSSPQQSGTIRLAGLAAGATTVSVSTTVDGHSWTAPATVALEVVPPLWARAWLWALVGAGLAGLALWIQRWRADVQLQTERQRARIAMDLHDELGAGLGSISILAGLLRSGRVPAERALDTAGRIADTAEELAGAVTDIVWSMRASRHDLASLAHYLLERGGGLLDPERVRLRPELAEPMPTVPLSPPVARALQRIFVEALYNAARHAGASTIVLSVHRHDDRWELAVTDDGVGLSSGPPTRAGGGSGLQTMRKRAEDIGADLVIEEVDGGGTRVAVRLPTHRPSP